MTTFRRANIFFVFLAALIVLLAFGAYRFMTYGQLILPKDGGPVSADTTRPVDYPSGMVKRAPVDP